MHDRGRSPGEEIQHSLRRTSTDSVSSSAPRAVANCLFEYSSYISEGGFLPGKRSKKYLSYMSSPVPFLLGVLLTSLVATPSVMSSLSGRMNLTSQPGLASESAFAFVKFQNCLCKPHIGFLSQDYFSA